MKQGPALAAQIIFKYMGVEDRAIYLDRLLHLIIEGEGWASGEDAIELVGRWQKNFANQVKLALEKDDWAGPYRPYELVEGVAVRGTSCCLPADDEETVKAKGRRAHTFKIDEAIRRLHHREVEIVCKWMLTYLGCPEPHATQGSGDGGIDFYGRCDFDDLVQKSVLAKGMERQLKVWLVGQAKHYPKNPITTANIRELIGSITLARFKIFAGEDDPQDKLHARIADPIFSLFVTTGRFSADSMELFRKTGIIAIDGLQLAQHLADNHVGIIGGVFSQAAFDRWVSSGPIDSHQSMDLDTEEQISH